MSHVITRRLGLECRTGAGSELHAKAGPRRRNDGRANHSSSSIGSDDGARSDRARRHANGIDFPASGDFSLTILKEVPEPTAQFDYSRSATSTSRHRPTP
jgi:hypothetical protein